MTSRSSSSARPGPGPSGCAASRRRHRFRRCFRRRCGPGFRQRCRPGAGLEDALKRHVEPDQAGPHALRERVEDAAQAPGDIGDRADDVARRGTVPQHSRGGGQHQQQRQPAAHREAQQARRPGAGDAARGLLLAGYLLGEAVEDEVFGAAGGDVARGACRPRHFRRHALLGEDGGALARGVRAEQQPQQDDRGKQRRDDVRQRGGQQGDEAGERAHHGARERTGDGEYAGDGVPDDLRLVRHPRDGARIGAGEGAVHDRRNQVVAERLDDHADSQVHLPRAERPGQRGRGEHAEPGEAKSGAAGQELRGRLRE